MAVFVVYILYSQSGDRYYVGQTQELKQRLQMHNHDSESSYTSKYRPWKVMLTIPFENRSAAIYAEKKIKAKKSRAYIEWLLSTPEGVQKLQQEFSGNTD